MRTIRLREHQPTAEQLSEAELEEILAVSPRLIRVSRASRGQYVLRPTSIVGTVVLPSLRLLIRPKVTMENLFFLLGYATGLRWGGEDFPYAYEDDLFRAVAWWFDREVGRSIRHGLNRDYIGRQDTLTTLRGRVAVDRQLAVRPGQPYPLECRFQEFSEDIRTNQVLKAAHNSLLRTPGLDQSLALRLRHRSRQAFGDVSAVAFRPTNLPPISFNRLNRHWESAVRLAQIILRQQSLRDEQGNVIGSAFTVDMNRLFERFIQVVVEEELRNTDLALEPQARRELAAGVEREGERATPSVYMRPDLLLLSKNQAVAVGDAKYKQLQRIGDWEHPDLYQLLAYCVRLGLDRGLLIYASKRALTESTVHGTGITLATIGVDLSGSPGRILTEARNACRVLLDAATGLDPAGSYDRPAAWAVS